MKDKNRLIPKLRFPEFVKDGEWFEKELNELGNMINGLTYSPNDIREEGLLVLRSSNIQNGQIDLSDSVFVKSEIKGANLTEPDDILVCVRNGSKALIGKNALISKDIPLATHGAFMTIFRAKHPKFVFQLFQTERYDNQVKADLGATINSINGKNFLKYKFLVPKTPEQQKIASFLSNLDELIQAHKQKLELLKAHKKGLMQNLFPQEGEKVPKLRFPEFKDDGEWVEKKLGKIAKVTTGNKDTQNKVDNGKYPFFVRSQTVERIDSYSYDGEAILTSGDGVGVGKNFHYIRGKFDFHQRVYCICDFDKETCGQFVFMYFSQHFYERVMKMSAKNSVDSVRKVMITEMPINMPFKQEQQKIASCLSSLDELITAQAEKIEQLERHKKGLMQGAFPETF